MCGCWHALQGEDNDEAQSQPVWMQEQGEEGEGGSPTASGGLPSLPVPSSGTPRSPASANGGGPSGDLVSLSDTPRANGGQPPSPAPPAAPRDPLADLYSLGEPAPEQRSPGEHGICVHVYVWLISNSKLPKPSASRCRLVVRSPRCGRGDLRSNLSSDSFYYLFFV